MGFKEKLKDLAGNALIKGGKLKDSASVKAKELSVKAKLKTDLLKYNSEVKKLYTDLGSLYYCLNKEAPQSELKQTCENISALLEKIEKAEEELKSFDAENVTVEAPDEEAAIVEQSETVIPNEPFEAPQDTED